MPKNPFKVLHKKFKEWRKPGSTMVIGASTGTTAAATLPSTTIFQANPRTFILNNACSLHAELENAATQLGRTFNKSTYGTGGNEWKYIETGTVQLSAKLQADATMPGVSMIRAFESATGPKVSFLPWYPDMCTYTYIDPLADLCLTGPLTGCHIFVATKTGFPAMLIHANANATDSSLAVNMQAKDSLAASVVSREGYTITHRLKRGDYDPGAFVWGARNGAGVWEYYVHDDQLGGSQNNLLPPP